MHQRMFAKVFVDKALFHIDKAFDYVVPHEFIDTLQRGCRVLVPFGNGNKKIQGMVENVFSDSDYSYDEGLPEKLKPIASQIDSMPIFTEEMFTMMNFLVKNTFCTYYDAIKTILPIGTNIEVTERYKLAAKLDQLEMIALSEKESRLVEFLKTAKSQKELNEFLECKGNVDKKAVVKSLLEKGIIKKCEQVKSRVAKKTIKMVKINPDIDVDSMRFTPKQEEAVRHLRVFGSANVKELCYFCGMNEGVIKNLAKKQILQYFQLEKTSSYEQKDFDSTDLNSIALSKKQTEVYTEISKLIDSSKPNVGLLHGITGSGKTQVYVKLIEYTLRCNKNAILLVPEISLTPQMVDKLAMLFGDIIAVIHSNLTPSERLDAFKRICDDQVKIVVGTRSAVFSPLRNIGIIILDEEGEASYKSDAPPRYHAREIAKLRCVNHNATLLLGSATPSIESYYYAKKGVYSLFTLDERFNNANLPTVYTVDMREEQQLGNLSAISEILGQQLILNLKENNQSILLINRRGYNTAAACMKCGEVMKCPSCDVAMTYHKANGYMMCHYCGHTKKFTNTCSSCKSDYIKLTGLGTQRLEDDLHKMMPSARILRMDTDTTYSRYSYEEKFDAFRRGEYDILLGTQMIAKGLDFPNVTLVGVINADNGLNSADFKAGERIFSLITQVVGRSGRSEKAGRAYIQAVDVSNPIISMASNQDYASFYNDEIASRRLMVNPPFCDICIIGFSSPNEDAVKRGAQYAMSLLCLKSESVENIAMKVLGVSQANIYKVSNKYRYRIIIKCRMNNSLKLFLADFLRSLGKNKKMAGISIYADINGDINS